MPYEIADGPGRLVATAIHAGTQLRPDVDVLLRLDRADKRREEDPYTDRLVGIAGITAIAHRSRFEVDLNRPRDGAVYRRPEDAWGLELWEHEPPEALVADSLAIYDAFYADLAVVLDRLAADGPFVVYDLHSYNHRRDGAGGEPACPADNPEINVGTGTMARNRFAPVVGAFMLAMRESTVVGARPDVRENVKFRGGQLGRWAHARYPGAACVLSIEFKKTFMDEWTDELDESHLADLRGALDRSASAVETALRSIGATG